MSQALRELEELVVDAWPARETAELDGWLLRASGGPSRRGNSVAALSLHTTRPLDELITEVERWYAAHERPAAFQLGPCAQPKELDQVLATRGYRKEGATAYAGAPAFLLSALPRRSDASLAHGSERRDLEVRVTLKPDAGWLEVSESASRFAQHMENLRGFFKRLGSRCRFATVRDPQGSALACCLGIASEERLGVYAMITRPEARRRGAARALLRGLAESALKDAMRELYLLVELENLPARALYEGCGFRDQYSYHYRIAQS